MNDSAIFGMLGLLIGGAGVWAVMRWNAARPIIDASAAIQQSRELHLAHSRLSDAHNTQSARIERALDQVTEGANATVVRMARILKGDL